MFYKTFKKNVLQNENEKLNLIFFKSKNTSGNNISKTVFKNENNENLFGTTY